MKHTVLILLCVFAVCVSMRAQTASEAVSTLASRVSSLESHVNQLPNALLVSFLFGAFCALWAMNSGRNSWLWFFLGLFFSVITVLVLLLKNSRDRDGSVQLGKRSFKLEDFRQQ